MSDVYNMNQPVLPWLKAVIENSRTLKENGDSGVMELEFIGVTILIQVDEHDRETPDA